MTEDEARRRAADPTTPAAELSDIAQAFPSTHVLVAQNPNAYPDLIAWISEQPAPTRGTTTTNPFTGVSVPDMVRDGAAMLMLFLGLFYHWKGSYDRGAELWYVIVATILAFLGVAFSYVARLGVLGPSWNHGVNRLIRLLTGIPYVLAVLTIFIVDIIDRAGVGPGALIGVVAIVLVLSPRSHELDPHRQSVDDAVWYWLTVAFGGIAVLAILGSGVATFIDVLGYSTNNAIFGLLTTLLTVAWVAIVVVGVAQRRLEWVNLLAALAIIFVVIDVLHFDQSLFGMLGFAGSTHGESLRVGPFGLTLLAAAGACALTPAGGRLLGPRLTHAVVRSTSRVALLVLAIWSFTMVLTAIQVLTDRWARDYAMATAITMLMLYLAAGAICLVAHLSMPARPHGDVAVVLGLLAVGVWTLTGVLTAIVAAIDDLDGSPTGWFGSLLIGGAVALGLAGPAALFSAGKQMASRFASEGASVAPAAPPRRTAPPPPTPPRPATRPSAAAPPFAPSELDPEVARQVQDPSTPAADLARIAYDQPQARAAVAAHPQAYAGLLEWLGSLGDPAIDAALAEREV